VSRSLLLVIDDLLAPASGVRVTYRPGTERSVFWSTYLPT
jgi:hypothetical protein